MTTLTEFLLNRITEDETAAISATPGPWDYAGQGQVRHGDTSIGSDQFPEVLAAEVRREQDGLHIARHDPTHVLAECAAKRELIKAWQSHRRAKGYSEANFAAGLGWAVRAIVAVYDTHPDYNADWTLT